MLWLLTSAVRDRVEKHRRRGKAEKREGQKAWVSESAKDAAVMLKICSVQGVQGVQAGGKLGGNEGMQKRLLMEWVKG